MNVYIDCSDKRWEDFNIDLVRAARVAARIGGARPDAEISIILTDDAEIHMLNAQYRNIDRPTNVLSFELGDPQLLGDIYISFDTVWAEAHGNPDEFIAHTMHMAVHGTLHLLGYDHINDDDADVMQSLEIAALKKLGIKNPYADDNCDVTSCGEMCGCGDQKWGWCWTAMAYFLCGVVAAMGFAPINAWWATLAGVGVAYGLATGAKKSRGFWRGMCCAAPFGAGYAIAMFWWVLNSIFVVPELMQQFVWWTGPALLAIGLAGAIIFAFPFAVIQKFPGNHAQRPFLFAAAWTLVLWGREWMLTGFPWNPLANITLPCPVIANSMAVWGALGLGFVIVGLVAAAVECIRSRGRMWMPMVLFLILGAVGCFAGWRNIGRAAPTDGPMPVVRIVQPAVSQQQKLTRDAAVSNLENLVVLMRTAQAPVDLIVLPETTYPFVITDNDFPLAGAFQTPMITGALSYADGEIYNSMVIANADGQIEKIYHKSHLVPFGEYAPMGGILPSPANLSVGHGPEIMHMPIGGRDFTFAPAICYEIIFSDSLIPRGQQPHAIINITNDTWFGRTPGTYQHLDMVRRYAIESGVPVIRANFSGISAFVDSAGAITSWLDIATPGVLDGNVWGEHMTLYREIGRNGWMIVILMFSCLGVWVFGRRA